MSKFTLYRADVDSARLASVLGKVPGVAVADEETDEAPAAAPDDETAPPAAPDDETAPPAAWTDSDDDEDGLREKIPAPDTDIVDDEKGSVVKTYGLLGLGISMVMLGIATVGIWVYLRRKGGDGEASETPPPATGLDTAEPAPSRTEPSTGEPDTASPSDLSPVESAAESEGDEETPEPHGRTESDRTDVEWTTRDTTPEPAEPEEPSLDATESETDEDEPRPTESVDAAPLLGAAFLAVSGAVVKWLQSSGDDA